MKRILQKIKVLFKIAKLLSVDDSGNLQQGVFSYMGTEPKGQIFIPYGLMMNAPAGSQMMVFSQNGHESNAIALASDPNNRILKDLEPGEFAVGNYLTGSYILFKANGDIEIVANGDMVETVSGNSTHTSTARTVNAPTTFSDDVTVDGDLTNQSIVFLDHRHAQGADSDGDTEVDTEVPK